MLFQKFFAPLEGDVGGDAGDDGDEGLIVEGEPADKTGDPDAIDTGEGNDDDGQGDDASQDMTAKELARLKADLAKEKQRGDQFEARYNETRTNYNDLSSKLRRGEDRQPGDRQPEPKVNPWQKVYQLQTEYNAALDEDGQQTPESRKLATKYQEAVQAAQRGEGSEDGGHSRSQVDVRRELELYDYEKNPVNKEYPVAKLNEMFTQREMDLSEYRHQAEIRGAGGRAAYDEARRKEGETRLAKDIREGKRQIKSINSISNNRSDGRKTHTPGKLDPNSPDWAKKTDAELRADKERALRRSKH